MFLPAFSEFDGRLPIRCIYFVDGGYVSVFKINAQAIFDNFLSKTKRRPAMMTYRPWCWIIRFGLLVYFIEMLGMCVPGMGDNPNHLHERIMTQ
jgi:hypothetical protein